MRKAPQNRRRGFTLVETVVTVGIIAALAAVVYPTVVKQFDSADPAKTAEDLNNITTAIEVFGVNVRPQQPHEIEDLVNAIQPATVGDSTALGAAYSAADANNWNGPYLALSLPPTTASTAQVINSGFDATIQNRLPLFDADVANGGDSVNTAGAASADFVSVRLAGLSGSAFNAINELIDGPGETTATLRRHSGKFRCPGAGPTDAAPCAAAFYLASPLRQ